LASAHRRICVKFLWCRWAEQSALFAKPPRLLSILSVECANLPLIEPSLLLLAYRSGVFPMADARDDPEIFWVEPKRRGILPLDGFHCSHSLARSLRKGDFTVTCNAAFARVVQECAAPRPSESGQTWISHRIAASYCALHEVGLAHSIEVWRGDDLVGGLYGVGFDRVFCGESMFSRVSNASKVALAWLVVALRMGGIELLDCQFITPHLASLGAIEITQKDYMNRLDAAPSAGAASLATGFGAALAAAKSAGFSSSPGNFIAQSLTQTS